MTDTSCWNCKKPFSEVAGSIYEVWAYHEDGSDEVVALMCSACYAKFKEAAKK